MFLVWRKLVRWLRTLLIHIGRKEPINASAEMNQLITIVNEALDQAGVPPMPTPNPTPSPTPAPSPNGQPVKPKRGPFRRLLALLRGKNNSPPTTPSK